MDKYELMNLRKELENARALHEEIWRERQEYFEKSRDRFGKLAQLLHVIHTKIDGELKKTYKKERKEVRANPVKPGQH